VEQFGSAGNSVQQASPLSTGPLQLCYVAPGETGLAGDKITPDFATIFTRSGGTTVPGLDWFTWVRDDGPNGPVRKGDQPLVA
jgi:hypothetical protein